jgi:hypothetical protein
MTKSNAVATQPVAVYRLPLIGLRAPNTHLRRVVLGFRREVEKAVLKAKGEIGVYAASRIHTACLAVRQAARIDRILATAGEPGTGEKSDTPEQVPLTHEQWLAYSDRLLKAKETADKALQALGLDRDAKEDVWDVLYSATTTTTAANRSGPPILPEAGPEATEANKTLPDANLEEQDHDEANGPDAT